MSDSDAAHSPGIVQSTIARCRENAVQLITAARKVMEINAWGIAFHLATLALEEIGKSSLLFAIHAKDDQPKGNHPLRNHLDDHVKKLFWALWLPHFGRERITKEQLESLRGLAQRMHNRRLRGLYVDLRPDDAMEISNDVSAEEANQQIELSAARLNLDGNSKARELNECERDALRWLAEATEDLEQRRLIFGDKSMDKLIEFGHVLQWIGWLREEFEKADRLAAELTRAELQRQPADSDKAKPRWRFKVRLHSGSHTVGHRALATWNDRGSWIKLIQVSGKQHELLVEMTFPSTLVIQNLYFAGWGAIRRFVVALNIGSLGFFWWYVPQQVSRFYEQLTDLESDSKLELDYSPRLVLDWKREGLSEIDLRNTAVCFGFLPYPDDAAECVPLNHYIMGLTWLSKSDIHLQLELDVFREFYLAMKTTYELNRADLTVESFEQLADKLFNNSDEGKKFQELASRVISGSAERKDITLREAGIMKLLADAQLLSRCQQLAALKKT